MHDVLKRYQVQVLRDAGLTLREVAEKAGVSPRSVDRILLQPRVTDLASSVEARAGRPSVARVFEGRVRSILEAEPELPTVEVLRRVREQGYAGRKTALYELVADVHPKHSASIVRFEGVAGEFSQQNIRNSQRGLPRGGLAWPPERGHVRHNYEQEARLHAKLYGPHWLERAFRAPRKNVVGR